MATSHQPIRLPPEGLHSPVSHSSGWNPVLGTTFRFETQDTDFVNALHSVAEHRMRHLSKYIMI